MRRTRRVSGLAVLGTTAALLALPVASASAAATPTGRIVFYSQARGNGLWSVSPAGGDRAVLANTSIGERPAPSPTGARLAFTGFAGGNHAVFRAAADGSNAQQVTLSTEDATDAAWSPDGSKLALSSNRGGSYDIWITDLLGDTVQRVTSDAAYDGAPSWSPDGTRLVYVKRDGDGLHLHVVGADGTGDVKVTAGGFQDYAPAWSPDGTRIAFASDRAGTSAGYGDLFTMAPDGTDVVQLTSTPTGYESEPAWSPDGGFLAYRSSAAGHDDIWVMGADGSSPYQLTDDAAVDDQPTWRPSAPAAGTPALTVSPDTDLTRSGQSVTVTGSGFTPDTLVQVRECRPGSCGSGTDVVPDATGAFSLSLTVSAQVGGAECTGTECYVNATSWDVSSDVASAAITFRAPDAPPAITVTPSTGLDAYGATVHIVGSGFPAGASVVVRLCTDLSSSSVQCDQVAYPTADSSGAFTSDPTVTWWMANGHTCSSRCRVSAYVSDPVTEASQAVSFTVPTAAITVTPTTNLDPAGATLHVTGSGLPPSTQLTVLQCNDISSSETHCDQLSYPKTLADGTFSDDAVAYRTMLDGAACTSSCRIRVYSASPYVLLEQAISFAVPTPAIAVTPSTGLNPYGAAVHLTGSGFPAGATVFVSECSGTASKVLCDQKAYPVADAHGNVATDLFLTSAMSSGSCTSSCRVRAYVPSPTTLAETPISWATRVAKPAITASPSSGLPRAGANVTVTGSAFPAGQAVSLLQCAGTVCEVRGHTTSTSTGGFSSGVFASYAMSSGVCSTKCRVRAQLDAAPSTYAEAGLTFAKR